MNNKPTANDLLAFIKKYEHKADQSGTKFRHKDLRQLKKAYDNKVLSESGEKGLALMNILFHLKYGMSVRYNRETRQYSVGNPFQEYLMCSSANTLLARIGR